MDSKTHSRWTLAAVLVADQIMVKLKREPSPSCKATAEWSCSWFVDRFRKIVQTQKKINQFISKDSDFISILFHIFYVERTKTQLREVTKTVTWATKGFWVTTPPPPHCLSTATFRNRKTISLIVQLETLSFLLWPQRTVDHTDWTPPPVTELQQCRGAVVHLCKPVCLWLNSSLLKLCASQSDCLSPPPARTTRTIIEGWNNVARLHPSTSLSLWSSWRVRSDRHSAVHPGISKCGWKLERRATLPLYSTLLVGHEKMRHENSHLFKV